MKTIDDGSNPGLTSHDEPYNGPRNNDDIENTSYEPEVILPQDPNHKTSQQPVSRPNPDRWELPDESDHIKSGKEIPDRQPTEVPTQPQEV